MVRVPDVVFCGSSGGNTKHAANSTSPALQPNAYIVLSSESSQRTASSTRSCEEVPGCCRCHDHFEWCCRSIARPLKQYWVIPAALPSPSTQISQDPRLPCTNGPRLPMELRLL